MSRACLSRYETVLFSLDCQAVTTGTVKPSLNASASLKRMRGRRAHARHTESGTFGVNIGRRRSWKVFTPKSVWANTFRSEEHTSELQSQSNLVCRLLLEKKKTITNTVRTHA